jgi:hypothetical protein
MIKGNYYVYITTDPGKTVFQPSTVLDNKKDASSMT